MMTFVENSSNMRICYSFFFVVEVAMMFSVAR